MNEKMVFCTLVSDKVEALSAILFVRSLRRFGSAYASCPVWVFARSPDDVEAISSSEIVILPLNLVLPAYFFAGKVAACAQAEELCSQNVHSLVWFNPECLVIQPPAGLQLSSPLAAAFRPVHICNVGSPIQQMLDPFWCQVYAHVGLKEIRYTVESFVDQQVIRPYFNSHIFSVCPSEGLLTAWLDAFKCLVRDTRFQADCCASGSHRVFLHQAVLSALIARLPQERLRILPAGYSYPLHLHQQTPVERRACRLNELVCPVYEDEFHYPHTLNGLAVDEPLASWLAEA